MRALVTGGCGFIGSHLVDLLSENNCEVLVIDDLSTGSKKNINKNAKYLYKNIIQCSEEEFLEFSPDYLFHLAALPRIQPSFENPVLHDEVNVRASLYLFGITKRLNLKAFVYSSSSACYGDPLEFPTSEDAVINPLSPYALQKYTSERYLHILGIHYKVPVVSLRYFNVYGPRSFNPQNSYNAYSSVVGIFNERKKRGGNY